MKVCYGKNPMTNADNAYYYYTKVIYTAGAEWGHFYIRGLIGVLWRLQRKERVSAKIPTIIRSLMHTVIYYCSQ